MDKPADWRTGSRMRYSHDFKLRMVELASLPGARLYSLIA